MSVSDACESVALRVEAQKREKSMLAIAAGDRNLNGCSIRSSGLHRYDPCACVRRIDRSDRHAKRRESFCSSLPTRKRLFSWGDSHVPTREKYVPWKNREFVLEEKAKKEEVHHPFLPVVRTNEVSETSHSSIPPSRRRSNFPTFRLSRPFTPPRQSSSFSGHTANHFLSFFFIYIYILKNGSAFNSVRRFDDFSSFSAIIYPRCFFPPPSSPLSFLSFIPPTVVLAPINFFVYLVFFPSPPLSFPLLFLHTSRIMRE